MFKGRCCVPSRYAVVTPETRASGSIIRNFAPTDFLSAFVWQPLAVYAYLCIPRIVLVLRVQSSELQLTHGFFDQTLAYVGVLLGLYHLFRLSPSPGVRRA